MPTDFLNPLSLPDILREIPSDLALSRLTEDEFREVIRRRRGQQSTPPQHVIEKRRQIRILIDPGHGGNDYGAPPRPSDINRVEPREKNLVLDFALISQKHLEVAGYDIVMTRTSEEF